MNTGVVVATGTINGTYEGFLYLAYLLPLIQGALNHINRLDRPLRSFRFQSFPQHALSQHHCTFKRLKFSYLSIVI